MILCCRRRIEPDQTIFLVPNNRYRDRKLEIVKCPVCGALLAELTQFNNLTGEYETIRPKSKKTSRFLLNLQKTEKELKIKTGTKSGANWIYGVNKECKSGDIKQYSVNFNGDRKLVKVIKKNLCAEN